MAQGIPVQDVIDSLQKHILDQRDELRKRPAHPVVEEKTTVAIKQDALATCMKWEVLSITNVEAHELQAMPVFVTASSIEAARNKVSVRELLDMRLRRTLASRLLGRGRHGRDLEGQRKAQAEVLDYELFVADVGVKLS